MSRRSYLSGIGVVFARELGALFDTASASVYLAAGVLVLATRFMNEFFLTGRLDMTPLFDDLGLVAVVLLPALTMRSWAEERKTRTFELWMTLPLAPLQIVLGKHLAALALFALFLAGTLPVPFMLAVLGEPDLGLILSGYLGALCLGSLLVACGLFLSSLTSDQIAAFVGSVLAAAVLIGSGDPRFIAVLDGALPSLGLGSWLSVTVSALPHYQRFVQGMVEPGALVYFFGLSAAVLWLNELTVVRIRT